MAQLGGQLNESKCHIGESKVALLGHMVSEAGIEADPAKVQALTTLPRPTSVKELTSFIQKVRYLGRFIHLLSQLALPLQRRANLETLVWDGESEECFQNIKEVIGTLPVIMPPTWGDTFYVNPSVGSEALGAVLLQRDPKTHLMRPVYFVSRVMKETEKNYTAAEQMVQALMFATQRFCSYLLPAHFVVLTSEEVFPYVLQHIDVSARIAKWIIQLQEFDYTVMVEDSTRATLADILTHRFHEKKVKTEAKPTQATPILEELEDAFFLYFDGAY